MRESIRCSPQVDAGDGRQHKESDKDECWSEGRRRNGSNKWRKEQSQQETTSRYEDREAGMSSSFDAGCRFRRERRQWSCRALVTGSLLWRPPVA